MNRFIVVIAAVVAVCSCKKVDKNFPTPVYEVIADSMKNDLKPGRTIEFFEVDLNLFAPLIPIDTNEARYDIRSLEGAMKRIITVNLFPWDSASGFPSDSYYFEQPDVFGIDTIKGVSYSWHNASNNSTGIALHGKVIETVVLSSNGVTVTYPRQTIHNSQPIYKAKYPLRHRSSWSGTGIVQSYNFEVTAPALGLSSAPGEERRTIDYNNYVIAAGLLNFQGHKGSVPVLVVKESYTTRTDYYINGALAQEPFLNITGLSQGQSKTEVMYSYYSPVLGYLGTVFMEGTSTRVRAAYYKKLE